MVQGIIAGGPAAFSRATETTEDEPAVGARDLIERGFTACDVAFRSIRGRSPGGVPQP
jgi:N-acetylmuramic acid 6-phosphate etherase